MNRTNTMMPAENHQPLGFGGGVIYSGHAVEPHCHQGALSQFPHCWESSPMWAAEDAGFDL